MTIGYLQPLERARQRASRMLFHPFDLRKWLVMGFVAWLAELMGGNGGGGPRTHVGKFDIEQFRRELHTSWEWVVDHVVRSPLVFIAILLALGLILLLLWLSSRGKLIFLDTVVRDRAAVAEPWRRLGGLADSLFVWRLGFFVAAAITAALLLAMTLGIAGGLPHHGITTRVAVAIGFGAFAAFFYIFALAFVSLLLNSFVVPIMYRSDLNATAAWRELLPWLERHLGSFVLYAFFVLCFWIVVVAAVITVGLLTCCAGFLLLIIPYVGTVILLPVHVTYRALSLEFLAQFDPAFHILEPIGE